MRTFIVGTRQSELALTQTKQVIEQLKELAAKHSLNCDFQIKKFITKGDRILDVTLSKVGGKGLFVKEIEQAMLDGEIDFAVHSMKDMPSELPPGLMLGAVPKRVDARDCLISREGLTLDELPHNARIGTSSLRRASQLLAHRPDVRIESIRGNIDTRLRKLVSEGFDAIILAAAGLHRMGWQDRITEYLSPDICLPAVGQGALGIECRNDDDEALHLMKLYNDPETYLTVSAERAFLAHLDGGCQVPIGAFAVLNTSSGQEEITLTGLVGSPDGAEIIREQHSGDDPIQLGEQLGERTLERGADQILSKVRG